MKKISVIMPVYNSEEYLDMAIKSVLNQTFKDFELLLIDDGSTDNSRNICQKYCEQDARVRLFAHSNHGISYTRNIGIKNAVGTYITFIDNDDEYKCEMLENIYKYACENDADVVKFGYMVIEDWHKEGEGRRTGFRETRKVELDSDFFEEYKMLKRDGFFNMIWNGMYKREFIMKNHLDFEEKLVRGYEDWVFNYKLFPLTQKVYVWGKIEYIHYQRGAHSTSSNFHPNQIEGGILAANTERNLFITIKKRYGIELSWEKRAMEYVIELVLLFEKRNCSLTYKQKKEILKEILEEPCFALLKDCNQKDKFNTPQRLLLMFIRKGNINAILQCAHYYNKYIVFKKKRK